MPINPALRRWMQVNWGLKFIFSCVSRSRSVVRIIKLQGQILGFNLKIRRATTKAQTNREAILQYSPLTSDSTLPEFLSLPLYVPLSLGAVVVERLYLDKCKES